MDNAIRIRIRYLGAFAEVAKAREETCEVRPPYVGALIDQITQRHGDKFRLLLLDGSTGGIRPGATLLVNGARRELQYTLSDGDEVTLLTPIAGGSTEKEL